MVWTVAPAIILAVLSFSSIQIWDKFRYSPDFTDPGRAKILVVGQQFKWNIIYPGPDGKFGRYLEFPKPTDPRWPVGPNGKSPRFAGVAGPASLPYPQAVSVIARYIDTLNPLGKVFTDAEGRDDDYQSALGRTMYIPVNRPVEIQMMSKDVIHDFYLPNFRAQIYAVPGMTGKICFTATQTSKAVELSTRKTYEVAELPALLEQPQYSDLTTDIDNPPQLLTHALIAKFKSTGITKLTAYRPGYFDIVCAQICGLGHYTMQGRLIVLSQEEYDKKFPTFPHTIAR
jgi:heme/copper-type cytochrome/quinol oxidase subunit 2